MTDVALWELWVQRRDAQAFEQIVRRHADMVYATCCRILRNPTDAEDVAQACFEKLAGTRRGPARHMGAWLHRVATNLALNRLKSEQRRRDREARFVQEQNAASSLEWNDVYDLVDEAMLELPARLREVLVAHFYERQSHSEIAVALGMSRQTVTYRISKGVGQLRRSLQRRGVPIAVTALTVGLAAETAGALPPALTARLAKIALAGMNVAKIQPLSLSSIASSLTINPAVLAVLVVAGAIALTVVFAAQQRPEFSATGPAPSQAERAPQDLRPQLSPTQATTVRDDAPPPPAPSAPPLVFGTIRMPDGKPAARARVEVRRRVNQDLLKHVNDWNSLERSVHSFTAVFDEPKIVAQAETDAEGTFRIGSLPAEEELLFVVVADGATGGSMVTSLGALEERELQITLLKTVTIAGSVVTEANEAVAQARIRVWGWYPPQESPFVRRGGLLGEFYGGVVEAQADEKGSFELISIPEGWIVEGISADAPGYAPGFAWHEANFPKDMGVDQIAPLLRQPFEPVTITLQPEVRIRGMVTDAKGAPVSGAQIHLQGQLPNRPRVGLFQGYTGVPAGDYHEYTTYYRRTAMSREDGTYTLSGVHPTLFQIDAVRGDRASDFQEFAPQSSAPMEHIDFVLQEVGSISGTVIEADTGKPVKTQVFASWAGIGNGDRYANTNSDAAGRFHLEGCRSGSWQIDTVGEVTETSVGSIIGMGNVLVALEPGQHLTDLRLSVGNWQYRAATIEGVVYDAANRPVAGAEVFGAGETKKTDEQGFFSKQSRYPGYMTIGAYDAGTGMTGISNTTVVLGQQSSVDIFLTLAPASGSGNIYGPNGELYTEPLELRLWLEWGQQRMVKAEGGHFDTGPIPPGDHRIELDRQGFIVEPQSGHRGRVEAGQHIEGLDFVVTPMTGVVSGTVRYPDGSPAKGIWLQLRGWNVEMPGVTDQDGKFNFSPVGGEDIELLVGHPAGDNGPGDEQWIALSHLTGESRDLDIVMQPLGHVTGTVLADFEACPRLWVAISGASGFHSDLNLYQTNLELNLQPDVYRLRFAQCVPGPEIEEVVIEDILVESNKTTDLGDVEILFKSTVADP